MMRRCRRHSALALASVLLAGCLPSVGGLAAAGNGGGGREQIVNPTIAVVSPPANIASTSLQITATTTPSGQDIEGNLDDAGWHGVASPWSLTGLAEGPHTARLRVAGRSATAQTVNFRVDTTAPTTPTGLTVTADRAGRLSVAWTASTETGSGIDQYTIAYGTTPGALDAEASAAGDATTAHLTGLDACQTYCVTIRCTDLAGNASSATAEVAARANCGGDGRFSSAVAMTGSSVDPIARGDFNGDGIPDLAVGDVDAVAILLGNGGEARGDGTFTAGQTLSLGSWVQRIAVADFDADHIDDLAILNSTELRIYLGQGSGGVGDGTFTLHQNVTTNLVTPQALLVHDFDADHIQDIVVGDWSGDRLVVFTGGGSNGHGDGSFTFSSQIATGEAPGAIAWGDFNRDGVADLAVACQSGTDVLVTHLGNGASGRGDGTFAAMHAWLTGGFVAGDVLVSDMNSDGVQDLVVTLALANAVCFMQGVGNGTFYLAEVVGVGTRPWGLVTGDFTGDGIVDYASLSYLEDGVTLIATNGDHGRGDGSFTTSSAGGEGSRLFRGVTGDFDGNGSLDMVVGDLDGNVILLASDGRKGIGDGAFFRRASEPSAIGTAFGVAVQDLDSDKVPDVMVASFQSPYSGGSDYVLQYLNVEQNGLGTGSLPSGQLLFTGSAPVAFAFGDFEHDGITDIAVVASDLDLRGGGNRVDLLRGAGSGGVGTGGVAASTSIAVGTTPRAIVSGDFDNDAITDLVVVDYGSDDLSVLLGGGTNGVGDGTFSAAASVTTGTSPIAIVAADFDSDGILDVAVGTATGGAGGELRVLLGVGTNGVGTGTFAPSAILATTNDLTGLVAGDFTGDGILDIVGTQWRASGGTSTSGVILFTGTGTGTFTAGAEIATGTDPFAIATADFDGDGILDLAVTDTDTAQLAILIGNGSDGRGNGTFATPTHVTVANLSFALAVGDLDSDGIVDIVAVGGSTVSVCFGAGDH